MVTPAVADALLPTLHALLCFCWPVQHMPLPSLWSSLTEVIRKVPQLPSTAPGGQEASECSSLCTLISTKGYSLWAAAPELAQQERKSSRCLILEPVCVQVWCICPSPVLCGCVHALMLHTHIHSQSGIPQESLRWPTRPFCYCGALSHWNGRRGHLQSYPPSLERVSPPLVPSCLMRWDPLLADGRQHRARKKMEC